ncbi:MULTISPECIES: hypothetical protein [Gordonia]|nr:MULTISPECIES: hypothetical protein [Gordonia]
MTQHSTVPHPPQPTPGRDLWWAVTYVIAMAAIVVALTTWA